MLGDMRTRDMRGLWGFAPGLAETKGAGGAMQRTGRSVGAAKITPRQSQDFVPGPVSAGVAGGESACMELR